VRPTCCVFIATSLDGCIAGEGGDLSFLKLVARPGEDYGYHRFFDSVDALVIGRLTYETALGFGGWPYGGKRCVVLAHTPPAPRHGEAFHTGDVAPLVARLGAEGVRRIYVDGGQVVRQFLAAGLVDELTLSLVPVVLGSATRLFGPGTGEHRLELVASRAFESGLVQLTYRRLDAPLG
jgi:dihydrofolate reductase